MAEPRRLRSQSWFDNPKNPDMTALYLERYLNFGLSLEELQSGMPIIGIAQTGSDLSPCNRHHLVLADRVREGVREAGGIVEPGARAQAPCSRLRVSHGRETEKRKTIRWTYSWPGSTRALGKSGWFGASGNTCGSRHSASP